LCPTEHCTANAHFGMIDQGAEVRSKDKDIERWLSVSHGLLRSGRERGRAQAHAGSSTRNMAHAERLKILLDSSHQNHNTAGATY